MGEEEACTETISTRSLIAAGREIERGISQENAIKYCLLNGFSRAGGEESEYVKAKQIVQKVIAPEDCGDLEDDNNQ